MFKRMLLGLCVVLAPSVALAQGTKTVQENYLPAKSQLYFRFDGMEQHRAAFDKTAVGKMLKGDTGKFLDELWNYVLENAKVAGQNDPKVEPLLLDLTKVAVSFHKEGFVLGVQVDNVVPPSVQAVMVFPKAAGESGTVLSLIQKIAKETKAPVKSSKVGKRLVHTIDVEVVKLGWWGEGSDAVVYLGTSDPMQYAKDIDAKKTGLAKNALYQKVRSFKDFPTAARGYLDIAGLLDLAREFGPPAGKIIDEVGFDGLRGLTFVSGFDGPAERSVVELETVGPRKGLLSLASQRKITLNDLPVLPDDVTAFSASSANLSKSYDVITRLITRVVDVAAPEEVDNVKEGIKSFEKVLGVDINKDLFGNFGDIVVSYNSSSDGILGTGAVVAISLKDAKKMSATIEKIVKAVPLIPGGGRVVLKKSSYHGGTIFQVGLEQEPINSHIASIGIYKGWFVYSQYPTAIKGFILRQEGELPGWKANDELKAALAQFPSEFNAIQVSDPRPTVKTVLAIAPLVFNLANTFGQLGLPGYKAFDLELIPHPQEATRHLFPNVTVTIDDGKRIRSETRGSLLLPF